MEVTKFFKKSAHAIEKTCKKHLPASVIKIGGRIYTYLSFREKKAGENTHYYLVKESVATLAKAYFLIAAVSFTFHSVYFLASSIAFGTIFLIARSNAVEKLFAKFKKS